MNKKGFGVTELLIFIVAAVVILSTVYIVYLNAFEHKNIEIDDEPNVMTIIEKANENSLGTNSSKTKTTDEHEILEQKLMNTAKNYISNKEITYPIKITSDTLIEEGYMTTMKDKKGECSGYVTYNNDNYYSYIKCKEYETIGYGI